MSSLPASIKKIRSKTTEKSWRHRFSHCNSMGAFCCHGNQSFDLICPKTLCSLSPIPVMLHIKFDLGWPAGFRDIQVWKCGRRRRRRTTDDGRRRTDDGPLLYYKLTLWAFGSGELIRSWVISNQIGKYFVRKITNIIHFVSCICMLCTPVYQWFILPKHCFVCTIQSTTIFLQRVCIIATLISCDEKVLAIKR